MIDFGTGIDAHVAFDIATNLEARESTGNGRQTFLWLTDHRHDDETDNRCRGHQSHVAQTRPRLQEHRLFAPKTVAISIEPVGIIRTDEHGSPKIAAIKVHARIATHTRGGYLDYPGVG